MLYLHCGWPKTGTKTLQAALFGHRDELADAGVVYPDRWQRQLLPEIPDSSHNGFVDVLDAIADAGSAVGEFLDFLAAHADRDVLISSEHITLWASRPECQGVIGGFFAAVRATMPVSCVWTLRRFDDFSCSLYSQLISMGKQLPPPMEFAGAVDPGDLFAGMRRFEECADEATYVKYRRDGKHNADLLRELGIPTAVRAEIAPMAVDLRLNPSPSRPCELIDEGMRRRLRDSALRCSAEGGPPAYARFFESGEAARAAHPFRS